jgi:HD domain
VGSSNDLFTGLLTLRLGRYREQFAAHFNQSLNTDRSMRALLFFAALYHDVSKPATKSAEETGRIRFFGHDEQGAKVAVERAQALNLSNDEIERLKIIIENHMRFHFFTSRMESKREEPSRKAIYRFFRDAGEGGVDLVLLGLADLRGTRGHTLTQESWTAALDVARILLENYWEKPQETISPPRLINGLDVMNEYQLEAGPPIGQLLEAIREAQATGKVSTREEALAFGREWLKENQK